jgi:hypothetical protein
MNHQEVVVEATMITEIRMADPSNWEKVESVLVRHYHKPDLQAARALYAGIAAHRLSGQPVWPMLVGPPGSMKTELLNGLKQLKGVHFIDQITANTFISGQIVEGGKEGEAPPGLLNRIGKDGIMVYPDFSTVLAMKQEARASILADMRRIFDGELRKEYGTGNNMAARKWTGRMTFAVGATPDVDTHYAVFQSLGERFVMIRWGRPDGIQSALRAMNQDGKTAQQELQEAVRSLFEALPVLEPKVSETIQNQIAALADIVTRARTHVQRSGYTKEMLYAPEPEAPTRLSQQLNQLAKGSALLGGRESVDTSDFEIVRRVGFDCIPTTRRRVIQALIRREDPKGIVPDSSLSYLLGDLEAVGLVQARDLSQAAKELCAMAGEFTRNTPSPTLVQ